MLAHLVPVLVMGRLARLPAKSRLFDLKLLASPPPFATPLPPARRLAASSFHHPSRGHSCPMQARRVAECVVDRSMHDRGELGCQSACWRCNRGRCGASSCPVALSLSQARPWLPPMLDASVRTNDKASIFRKPPCRYAATVPADASVPRARVQQGSFRYRSRRGHRRSQ